MESQDSATLGQSSSSFDFANHQFKIPTKKIDDPATLEIFKKSDAAGELLSFLGALAQSVQSSRMSETIVTDVKVLNITWLVEFESSLWLFGDFRQVD